MCVDGLLILIIHLTEPLPQCMLFLVGLVDNYMTNKHYYQSG